MACRTSVKGIAGRFACEFNVQPPGMRKNKMRRKEVMMRKVWGEDEEGEDFELK